MDQPERGSVSARLARSLSRSLSGEGAMMSEFSEFFTDTYIYGSIAVLAVCVFAAMWIARK
jgi:hypothetical protein